MPKLTAARPIFATPSRARSGGYKPIISIVSTSTASIARCRSRTWPARSASWCARARSASSGCPKSGWRPFCSLIKNLTDGQPASPKLNSGFVDVRNVADLHLRAMTDLVAKGQRLIATAEKACGWSRQCANCAFARCQPQCNEREGPTPSWVGPAFGRGSNRRHCREPDQVGSPRQLKANATRRKVTHSRCPTIRMRKPKAHSCLIRDFRKSLKSPLRAKSRHRLLSGSNQMGMR